LTQTRASAAGALVLTLSASGALAAAPAPPPSAPKAAAGFEMSIQEGAQLTLGALSVGLAYTGSDPYLDAVGVRQEGLHARIAIAIEHKPSLYQDPDLREGESVTAGGYRILMERIFPGRPRGGVIVRVWNEHS